MKLALWRLFPSSYYLRPKHSEVEDSLSFSAKYSVCTVISLGNPENLTMAHLLRQGEMFFSFSLFHGIVSHIIAIIFIALWCIVLAIKID